MFADGGKVLNTRPHPDPGRGEGERQILLNFADQDQTISNTTATGTNNILVIGYGNTLRGDDGVGPRVAEAVAALHLPGVRSLVCQQLSPEHAELISQVHTVVFVDASVEAPKEVQFHRLEPNDTSQLMAHAADPRTLLALSRDVFGRVPQAWWLTIPAVKLEFSEELTPAALRGVIEAVEKIQALCR